MTVMTNEEQLENFAERYLNLAQEIKDLQDAKMGLRTDMVEIMLAMGKPHLRVGPYTISCRPAPAKLTVIERRAS